MALTKKDLQNEKEAKAFIKKEEAHITKIKKALADIDDFKNGDTNQKGDKCYSDLQKAVIKYYKTLKANKKHIYKVALKLI